MPIRIVIRQETLLRAAAHASTLRLRRQLPVEASERTWVLELEVNMPEIDPEQLLSDCEDFLVDGRDGRQIGVVERVETSEPAGGRASVLLISAGWFGRRHLRVGADAILALVPAERRVIVDESRVTSAVDDSRPS